MDGRAWNSGYRVTVDGWQSGQWVSEVNSIREVARIFDEHGIQVSHSKVYHIQTQRDDREAGRPITRAIKPNRYRNGRNFARLGNEANVVCNIQQPIHVKLRHHPEH